jgi:hypothetical protein
MDKDIPSLEEILTAIDADIAVDNSPEQKELEAALKRLDRWIASGSKSNQK